MSTFLQLCNDLHAETGESGADLTTVSGVSGYQATLVRLIKQAWEEIQILHTDWRFLRKPLSITIVAGDTTKDPDVQAQATYTNDVDFIHKDTFSIYKTATGISDESRLTYVPWEDWKRSFGITYADGDQNRPTHITIDPDTNDILFGPESDDSYTIHFEFNEMPITLSSDGDEPNIHSPLQKAIVGLALMHYGESEESRDLALKGKKLYKRFLARMRVRYLPNVSIGEPLA